MKKKILSVLMALAVQLSSNAFEVQGRAPMELGVSAAKEKAIQEALIEASYRDNAYVAASTEMKNMAVSATNSIIKTSSLVKSYSILDEYQCGDFYCVVLDVVVGSSKDIEKTLYEKRVFISVKNGTGSSTSEQSVFLERLGRELNLSVNGAEGYSISEFSEDSDYRVELSLVFEKLDSGIWGRFSDQEYILKGSLAVESKMASTAVAVSSDNVFLYSSDYNVDELYDYSSFLKSKILKAVVELPNVNDFVISNLEGSTLYFKSSGMFVGTLLEVVFTDFYDMSEKSILGTVQSVFNTDVQVSLNKVPGSSYRLKKISVVSK